MVSTQKKSEVHGTVPCVRETIDRGAPHTKRERNNRLLAVQAEVSQAVHARWVGRTVDVLVEQVSKRDQSRVGAPAAPVSSLPGGVSLTSNGRPLRTPGESLGADSSAMTATLDREAEFQNTQPVQLSGRTAGDLITFFDSPRGVDASRLIGTIQTVHIQETGVLSLSGQLNPPSSG